MNKSAEALRVEAQARLFEFREHLFGPRPVLGRDGQQWDTHGALLERDVLNAIDLYAAARAVEVADLIGSQCNMTKEGYAEYLRIAARLRGEMERLTNKQAFCVRG